MSRGPGRIELAILAAIKSRSETSERMNAEARLYAVRNLTPEGVKRVMATDWTLPTHISSGQLFYDCYPDPNRGHGLDHRKPTPAQQKALVRAMHSVVEKFPQYALMGGQGREAPLWLYEPADPMSKLWAELQVKYGRHGAVTFSDVRSVADGGKPSHALEQLRRHRSYLRGARVVVKSGRIREVDDIAALAAKARALVRENDPDAIRDGLTEIANALDAITQAVPRADAL
jgi:hypothetical protein